MRSPAIMLMISLLCTACDADSRPNTTTADEHRWFRTYQTDRTCQSSRPPVHSEDIHSPTGRTHPF